MIAYLILFFLADRQFGLERRHLLIIQAFSMPSLIDIVATPFKKSMNSVKSHFRLTDFSSEFDILKMILAPLCRTKILIWVHLFKRLQDDLSNVGFGMRLFFLWKLPKCKLFQWMPSNSLSDGSETASRAGYFWCGAITSKMNFKKLESLYAIFLFTFKQN